MNICEILIVLICIYVPIIILLIGIHIKTTPFDIKYEFIIKTPKFVLRLGILGMIIMFLFTIMFTIFSYKTIHYIFYMVFGSFSWLFFYLYIKAFRFKVCIKGQNIYVQPLFSKKYSCQFKDIVCVKKQIKSNGAERLVITFSFNKKLVIENIEHNYIKLVGKIQIHVPKEKLINFNL